MNDSAMQTQMGETIDGLFMMAEDVMNARRFLIMKGDEDRHEADMEAMLEFHDGLIRFARRAVDDFGLLTTAQDIDAPEEPEPAVASTLADEIWAQIPSGWTISDLAKEAGVNKSTLDRIVYGETSRPQAKTLRKIEAALGLEEGHLDVE